MAILIDKTTKILVQGITGTQASFHVQRAIRYGTQVVGGVVPYKKEDTYLGIPLFTTVLDAKKQTGATASLIFVPANHAKAAILEAIDADLELVVVITSGIPVTDMMEIRKRLEKSKTILIGPNTPGIITPQEAYLGIYPDNIHTPGNIGVVSRSSTLTYEIILEINKAGFGESTVVGLGDDFIVGAGFIDVLKKFNDDEQTKAIVLIGGIGGNYEIEAARMYRQLDMKKPIIALIVENQMSCFQDNGLAPEILCHGITDANEKKQVLKEAGMIVVDNIQDIKNELLNL